MTDRASWLEPRRTATAQIGLFGIVGVEDADFKPLKLLLLPPEQAAG